MKIMVLAGGIPQAQLIQTLKKRFAGATVLLADYSQHPAAENYADKFYRVSTLDIPAIEKIAREEQVDFLITVCTDQALNTVAEVSQRLGLPCYIDAVTGRNVTNKRYMKQVFMENGIPTAKCVIVDAAPQRLPEGFTFPLVVKPVDCNSSKGVVRVADADQLRSAVQAAVGFSRTGQAIIEEFVQGKELSVDLYIHEGEPEVLCISESHKVKSQEKFVIFRGVYPAGIPQEAAQQIGRIARQITAAFGLKNGPMLIQLLYREGRLYVVEFSARTGGGLKYQLIRQVSGVDIIDATIDATLGCSKPHKKGPGCSYAANEFFYCHPGVFHRVEGFRELQDEGIIENYFVFKNPGTYMDKIASSGDRIASITLIADSFDQLCRKQQLATARVKVLDQEGRDILCHEATYPIEEVY